MSEVQTTLLSYEQKTSKAGKPFWKFTTSGGKEIMAFTPPLAQIGISMLGKPAIIQITEKPSQNPNFPEPSYFLNGIQPDHSVAVPEPSEYVPVPNGEITALPLAGPTERDKQIVRQSAYKAAVELAASYYTHGDGADLDIMGFVRSITDELAHYGLTGVWTNETNPDNTVPWDEA